MFALPDWFNMMGLMAWPLALCSVITVAIALERLLFFVRTSADGEANYHKMANFLDNNSHQPKSLRDELIANQVLDLEDSYHAGLKWLRTIGAISPMLGLLGTVLGIIEAFKTIAAQTGAISPNLIADGLWQAMLTTAVGLFIAIPAIFAAQFFGNIADKRLTKLSQRLDKKSLALALDPTHRPSEGYHNGELHSQAHAQAQAHRPSPISGAAMERWQP